jgi:hypothetical protein
LGYNLGIFVTFKVLKKYRGPPVIKFFAGGDPVEHQISSFLFKNMLMESDLDINETNE